MFWLCEDYNPEHCLREFGQQLSGYYDISSGFDINLYIFFSPSVWYIWQHKLTVILWCVCLWIMVADGTHKPPAVIPHPAKDQKPWLVKWKNLYPREPSSQRTWRAPPSLCAVTPLTGKISTWVLTVILHLSPHRPISWTAFTGFSLMTPRVWMMCPHHQTRLGGSTSGKREWPLSPQWGGDSPQNLGRGRTQRWSGVCPNLGQRKDWTLSLLIRSIRASIPVKHLHRDRTLSDPDSVPRRSNLKLHFALPLCILRTQSGNLPPKSLRMRTVRTPKIAVPRKACTWTFLTWIYICMDLVTFQMTWYVMMQNLRYVALVQSFTSLV